jgi:uncharacterized membrane protein YeaQ/YmgE (transglycosylase-associated protein family)
MLYPAAGIILWIFVGGLVGFIAGKVSNTEGSHGQMANLGVGSLCAVVAGFVTTFFFHGDKSTGGYWASIIIAIAAAVAGVSLFRMLYPRRVPTLR